MVEDIGEDFELDGPIDQPGDDGTSTGFPMGDPPDHFRCHAKSKTTGERCRHWAMRGKRVCRYHGGKSVSGPGTGAPLKHGLYSKFRQDLKTIQAEDEAQAFDLTPELEFLRAVLHRLDERITDTDLHDPEQMNIVSGVVREIRALVGVMRRPTEITAMQVNLTDTYVLEAIRLALEDYGGQQLVAIIGARAAEHLAQHRATQRQQRAPRTLAGTSG